MLRKPPTSGRPSWAKAIRALRLGLNVNQSDFGSRLGFSAMAISRWERGAQEPPSHGYIGLGNLASDSSCWYFWERAGLRSEHVLRVLPAVGKNTQLSKLRNFEIVSAGSGPKQPAGKIQLVAVPLLKVMAASPGERGDDLHLLSEAPVENMMAAPKDWCPNPAFTSCLRVKGNSMSPLIQDGYVVAVDSSQFDGSTLDGKIVIAWHKDVGLTISRLRLYEQTMVLVPENSEYKAVTVSAKQPWKIVATVLWWVGKAP
ncbi:MAG TPA: S24 family peptidase [Candidatus Acidoferrum sp.]|nr:S24 family peptidase [Candidatus Acidoferrum sp.]